MDRHLRTRGVTLVELLVVLVVLGLAAGIALPALLRPGHSSVPEVARLLPIARAEAAKRGETIHLYMAPTGQWRMEGAASTGAPPFAAGRGEPFDGPPFTLLVSVIGTCGFDVRSAAAGGAIALDPLTCELKTR